MKLRTETQIMEQWAGNEAPLVTLVCITYNHAHYIHECLDSFLMQVTDFPFEILIHDDASTDGTTDIVEDYAQRYPGLIRLMVQQENQYSQGRRIVEICLKNARGEYVALCEGDDYWTDPQKIQKQVAFLQSNPDYVLTYHRSQPFSGEEERDIDFGGARRDLSALELQKATPIFTLTTCFRNVIQTFPPEMAGAKHGDLFLWSLLGAYGNGKFMPDISPARFRVHAGGVFSAKPLKKKKMMEFVTHAALLSYYLRTGNSALARHFKVKAFVTCLRSLTFNELLHIFVKYPWCLLMRKRKNSE
jgi:glycosyltransferase involved in cell wall biosynthesis